MDDEGETMGEVFDARVRALLDAPNMAHIATVDRSGSPRVSPVWISADEDSLLLNTIDGRAWPKRLRRSGRIAVSIINAENPAEYVEICGSLAEETHEGADEHIDLLSRKYIGIDYPSRFEGEQRILIRINPDRVSYINLMERVPGIPDDAVPVNGS
ncbi:unannotated protein [freshwater metagenome]|uniref:Unannotated protein n=1 Tax=freshwater metagenome TaxID=449393 RepID=A0A6J7I2Z9_9ZZZZ|nr:TIGR03618 family F420-dependent PPOX class oxidoreductase [Actinomycetota bacterium]